MSSSPQWFTSAVNSSTTSKDSICYLHSSNTKLMSDKRSSSLCKMMIAPTSSKRKTKKPVKFDDGEQVVHQVEADSTADPQKLWFSKQEIRVLRQEGRDILAKVRQAGGDLSALDESVGESIRGLEHGLSVLDYDEGWNGSILILDDIDTAPLDRSERRKNIVDIILAQQQEHKDAGIDDPKGLQVTSKAHTQWAVDRALGTAEKDFEEAVEVWREDSACADLLPSILNKKSQRQSIRRASVMSAASDCSIMSACERKSALDAISKTIAGALEELDDEDLDF